MAILAASAATLTLAAVIVQAELATSAPVAQAPPSTAPTAFQAVEETDAIPARSTPANAAPVPAAPPTDVAPGPGEPAPLPPAPTGISRGFRSSPPLATVPGAKVAVEPLEGKAAAPLEGKDAKAGPAMEGAKAGPAMEGQVLPPLVRGGGLAAGMKLPPQADVGDPKPRPKMPEPDGPPKRPEPDAPLPERAAVPPAAKLAEAERAVNDVFKAEFERKKPADMQALAQRLLEQAAKTNDDPAARYVLCRSAVDLAARAGDLLLALRGVDELEGRFDVNGIDAKIDVLKNASQGQHQPTTMRLVAETCLALVEEVVDVNNYPAAARLLEAADAAARRAGSVPLQQRVQAVAKEAGAWSGEYDTARIANDALQRNPNNPEANLTVGRFVAFLRGNWDEGLPLLARGTDAKVTEAACRDLAKPEDGPGQAAAADGWWDLAQGQPNPARTQLLLRARHWYEQSMAQLEGFTRTRVEKRLKDIDHVTRKDDAKPAARDTFDYQVAMGRTFYQHRNYRRAVASFREALRLRPDDARVTSFLQQATYALHMANGYAYGNNGLIDDAAREFQAALALKPKDPAATYAMNVLTAPAPSSFPGRGREREFEIDD